VLDEVEAETTAGLEKLDKRNAEPSRSLGVKKQSLKESFKYETSS
jgi:hypothetical protein